MRGFETDRQAERLVLRAALEKFNRLLAHDLREMLIGAVFVFVFVPALAGEAAYLLSKSVRRPVCVIAGVHLDNITGAEIDKILANTKLAISEIINVCSQQKRVN